MSSLEELKKIFEKEIKKLNKKIKDLEETYDIIEYDKSSFEEIIYALDLRLIKLEKLNKIDFENDNNISDNYIDEGKLFRSQISTRSKAKKNNKNNEELLEQKSNSKNRKIFYNYEPNINYLEENKEDKKKESRKKRKSQNKNKKKLKTNSNFEDLSEKGNNINNNNNEENENCMDIFSKVNNINNSIDDENINNFNSLIIDNNNDNMFDAVSFGKNSSNNNNLNNSMLTTTSAKFSEFSFNPEKLLKKNNIKNNGGMGSVSQNNNKKYNNINKNNVNINNNTKIEYIINSEIIKNFNELNLIITSLPTFNKFDNYYPKFQIIFQSSLDGDSAKNFHKFCDSEPNIIVLVESKNNNRFGGYTKIGFSSDGEKKYDDSAFLFSFDENRIYRINKKYRNILCEPNIGPCFGDKDNKIFNISDNYLSEKSCFNKSNEFYYGVNQDLDDFTNKNQEFIINKLEIFKILI